MVEKQNTPESQQRFKVCSNSYKWYKSYLTLIFSDSKIDRLRIRDKDVGNVSAVWLRNDDLKIFNNWAIDYVEVRQVKIYTII